MKRGSLGEHQRSARVSQLVRVPVPEASRFAEPGEDVGEVVRVHRSADFAGEDQPVISARADRPPSSPPIAENDERGASP